MMRVNVVWSDRNLANRARQAFKVAASEGLEHILRESILIAPLDESTLHQSGGTSVAENIRGVEGAVYFDTPYAVRLHENPEYNFQNGRVGKYLEIVVNQEKAAVENYIRNRIRELFRT